MGWRRYNNKNLCGHSEYHITRNIFNPRKGRKEEKFHRKFVSSTLLYVQTPLSSTLSLYPYIYTYIHTFRVINGKEKKQIRFLNISIVAFLCNTKLTGTITSGQSEPGCNSNDRITSHSPNLEPYHQIHFNDISRIHAERVLRIWKGYTQLCLVWLGFMAYQPL